MKTLIIDDDPKSHIVLKTLLEREHPEIEVLASALAIKEGKDLIQKIEPDLIFLDIELPDGLGFELLVDNPNPPFQVIFITAHNKYAVTALHFGALDFLLKPIEKSDLKNSLQKVRNKTLSKDVIEQSQLDVFLDTYEKVKELILPSRIAIREQGRILYIAVPEIIRLEANGIFTIFHLDNNRRQCASSLNLGKYVTQFEPYFSFVQVHRGHLLNLAYVDEFKKSDRLAILKDGSEVPISRGFLEDFLIGMDKV